MQPNSLSCALASNHGTSILGSEILLYLGGQEGMHPRVSGFMAKARSLSRAYPGISPALIPEVLSKTFVTLSPQAGLILQIPLSESLLNMLLPYFMLYYPPVSPVMLL